MVLDREKKIKKRQAARTPALMQLAVRVGPQLFKAGQAVGERTQGIENKLL